MAMKLSKHMHMPVLAGYVFDFDKQQIEAHKKQDLDQNSNSNLDGILDDSLSEDSVSCDDQYSSDKEKSAEKIFF